MFPAKGELTKYLMTAFLSDLFGVKDGLLRGELVIGLVTFPDSIQPVIADRSYEKPSMRKSYFFVSNEKTEISCRIKY